MIGLLSMKKNEWKISFRYILITFFVCVSMIAWLGISDLRAGKNDPDNNSDEYRVRFKNAAQAQRADNVARQAALQDPLVNDLIDQGRYKAARAVYLGKVETLSRQITRMRAAGMGWGGIVHKINKKYDYELHPSVLGLGHSPKFFKESVHHSKYSKKYSKHSKKYSKHSKHSKKYSKKYSTYSKNYPKHSKKYSKKYSTYSKKYPKHSKKYSKYSMKKSESKMVQKGSYLAYGKSYRENQRKGFALEHSKNKSSNRGGGHGSGKSGGKGGGKGKGKK